MSKIEEDRFVPCTREISIGDGVVYRPIRSWHSGVYAGERLTSVCGDGSGCVREVGGREVASPPCTYMHRFYWHKDRPEQVISSFLSYPNGMGCCDQYFWEILVDDDCERFIGCAAEDEMEQRVKTALLRTAPEQETDKSPTPTAGKDGE